MNDPSSQWNFIEAAATKRGVTAEALRKWRVRGVPHKDRLDILDDAVAAGVALDRSIFDTPPAVAAQ